MSKTCCVCSRTIDEADDYDRIGTDFYCGYCSGLRLIACPICEACIDPDVDIKFQAPDGKLLCCKECLGVYNIN